MTGSAPVLTYATPLPKARGWARVIRWGMLGIWLIVFGAGVAALFNPLLELTESLGGGTLGTPFAPLAGRGDSDLRRVYAYQSAVYLAVFLISQYLFLFPRGRFRLESIGGGPLTRRSAAAAGFVGMLLSVGLLATILELSKWWIRLTLVAGDSRNDYVQSFWSIWPVMLLLWLVWSGVFLAYARTLDRYTAVTKIYRYLIAGTVLELFVAAPAHAWVVSQINEDCYCTRGSYTGVVFGCTAAVWLFGPGVLLLWYRERRRRERILMDATSGAG